MSRAAGYGAKRVAGPSTAGAIIQVKSASKTDTFTTASTSFVDVTDIAVTITPKNSKSTFKLTFMTMLGNADSAGRGSHLRFVRDGSAIAVGDAASNRVQATSFFTSSGAVEVVSVHMVWIDSPATASDVTYKVQARTGSSGTAVLGRNGADTDDANTGRTPSILIVEEIEG